MQMKKGCTLKSHRQVVCIGRMKFRFQGKENIFSIGTYPDTTLAQARRIRDEARLNLKDGINPNEAKKQKKLQVDESTLFRALAMEWMEDRKSCY